MVLPKIPTLEEMRAAFGDVPVNDGGTDFIVRADGTVLEKKTYETGDTKSSFYRHHAIKGDGDE